MPLYAAGIENTLMFHRGKPVQFILDHQRSTFDVKRFDLLYGEIHLPFAYVLEIVDTHIKHIILSNDGESLCSSIFAETADRCLLALINCIEASTIAQYLCAGYQLAESYRFTTSHENIYTWILNNAMYPVALKFFFSFLR